MFLIDDEVIKSCKTRQHVKSQNVCIFSSFFYSFFSNGTKEVCPACQSSAVLHAWYENGKHLKATQNTLRLALGKSEFRLTQDFQKTSKICYHHHFSLQSDPAHIF